MDSLSWSCVECSKVQELILSSIHSMKRSYTQSHKPSKAPSFKCLKKSYRSSKLGKILSKHLTDLLLCLSQTCQTKCNMNPTCRCTWIPSPFPVILREASSCTMDDPLERILWEDKEMKFAWPTLLVGAMIFWKRREREGKKDIIVDEIDRCWERRDPYYRRNTKMYFLRFIS